MAKLQIYTTLDSVVLCGQFCKWDIDQSIRIDREKGKKFITVNDMPKGEYRVFSCKNFSCGEIYPTDKRQMQNRFFSGDINETICVYFD